MVIVSLLWDFEILTPMCGCYAMLIGCWALRQALSLRCFSWAIRLVRSVSGTAEAPI
jgi:hypothetical protein